MQSAALKCSNCGAEITNLTLGWSKRQWLWGIFSFVPFVALVVWINYGLFRHSDSYADELEASLIDVRSTKDRIDIRGTIRNHGKHTWERVVVEAEFYDEEGVFIDETSEHIAASLSPNAEEHFRLTLSSPDLRIVESEPKVTLKIADASESRF
jgi:hypothetical protein